MLGNTLWKLRITGHRIVDNRTISDLGTDTLVTSCPQLINEYLQLVTCHVMKRVAHLLRPYFLLNWIMLVEFIYRRHFKDLGVNSGTIKTQLVCYFYALNQLVSHKYYR